LMIFPASEVIITSLHTTHYSLFLYNNIMLEAKSETSCVFLRVLFRVAVFRLQARDYFYFLGK
jgi:hypothetical protein